MKVIADLGRCPAHHHHNDCQTVRALLARPCGDHWGDDEGEGLLTGSVDSWPMVRPQPTQRWSVSVRRLP
jgi:hypothetical protein